MVFSEISEILNKNKIIYLIKILGSSKKRLVTVFKVVNYYIIHFLNY
jgi:hypothetical protein